MKRRSLLLIRALAAVVAMMLGAEVYARGQGPLAAALGVAVGFGVVYAIGLLLVRRLPDPRVDPTLDEPPLPPPRRAERVRQAGRRKVQVDPPPKSEDREG
jgi:hypothetical protein